MRTITNGSVLMTTVLKSIELHSVDHCTLSCNYCSHNSENENVKSYSAKDYDRWLDKISQKGIAFSIILIGGGEPLINENMPELISMAKSHTHERVSTMTNGWWLSSEEMVEKQAEKIEGVDDLCVTIYKPYAEKFGGISAIEDKLSYLQELLPELNIIRWGGPDNYGPVVRHFGVIEFTDEKKDTIPDFDCGFMECKQLLHTGIVLGCCASRRVLYMSAVDKFDLQKDFNRDEFVSWYNKDPLDLCSHCSIATKGMSFKEWTQKIGDSHGC